MEVVTTTEEKARIMKKRKEKGDEGFSKRITRRGSGEEEELKARCQSGDAGPFACRVQNTSPGLNLGAADFNYHHPKTPISAQMSTGGGVYTSLSSEYCKTMGFNKSMNCTDSLCCLLDEGLVACATPARGHLRAIGKI